MIGGDSYELGQRDKSRDSPVIPVVRLAMGYDTGHDNDSAA